MGIWLIRYLFSFLFHFLFLGGFLFASWAHAASEFKSNTRLLIIGDSLTAGYGVAKEDAYPAILERLLNQKHHSVTVINAGSSGSTSASAYGRLKWHLQKKTDLLLIALGGNDGLRGVAAGATRDNLAKTIQLAQDAGLRVLLAGMQLPMNYGQSYRAAFSKVFPELSQEYGVALIPFLLEGVGGMPEYNLPDGIHPNEAGHHKIATHVLPFIEAELEVINADD